MIMARLDKKRYLIVIDGTAGTNARAVSLMVENIIRTPYFSRRFLLHVLALKAINRKFYLRRTKHLSNLLPSLMVEIRSQKVFVDGEDVTKLLHSPETREVATSFFSRPRVFTRLKKEIRQLRFAPLHRVEWEIICGQPTRDLKGSEFLYFFLQKDDLPRASLPLVSGQVPWTIQMNGQGSQEDAAAIISAHFRSRARFIPKHLRPPKCAKPKKAVVVP